MCFFRAIQSATHFQNVPIKNRQTINDQVTLTGEGRLFSFKITFSKPKESALLGQYDITYLADQRRESGDLSGPKYSQNARQILFDRTVTPSTQYPPSKFTFSIKKEK